VVVGGRERFGLTIKINHATREHLAEIIFIVLVNNYKKSRFVIQQRFYNWSVKKKKFEQETFSNFSLIYLGK